MTDRDKSSPANGSAAPESASPQEARAMPFFASPPSGQQTGPQPQQQQPPLAAPTPATLVPPQPSGRHSQQRPHETSSPQHPQQQAAQPAPPPLAPQHPAQPATQPAPQQAPQPAPQHAPPPEPGEARVPSSTSAVVKGRITIEDEVIEKIAALAAREVDGVAALSAHTERIRVYVHDNEVSVDLAVVVEYGSVIMDVAKVVKSNVARIVSLMLGMRVTAVNVIVDDVQMPGERREAS